MLRSASGRRRARSRCALLALATAAPMLARAAPAVAWAAAACATACPLPPVTCSSAAARSALAWSSLARRSRSSITSRVSPAFTCWFSSTRTWATKPPTRGRTGVTCPSTCALSVSSQLRPSHQRYPKYASSARSSTPRMGRMGFFFARAGVASSATGCGPEGASEALMDAVALAMVSSLSFTGPRSAEVEGGSGGPGQAHPRRGRGGLRLDHGVARADQVLLGVDHLDVARQPVRKALLRLRELLVGQPQPLGGDALLL